MYWFSVLYSKLVQALQLGNDKHIHYPIVFLEQDWGWLHSVLCSEYCRVAIRVPARLPCFLKLRLLSQTRGFWKNLVPCGCKTEVFVFLLAASQGPFSTLWGLYEVLALWLPLQSFHNMTTYLFKTSRRICDLGGPLTSFERSCLIRSEPAWILLLFINLESLD